MILLGLIAILSKNVSAAEVAPALAHEVRKVMLDRFGYQEGWVKIRNPATAKDSRELPLELIIPFCNSKSVKKLDQYCAKTDGSVAIVTAIKGNLVSIKNVDMSTGPAFYAFANKARLGSSSRMPASFDEKEVVCEASCPQMDAYNPCQASGATKEKAYQELKTLMVEKADTDCKLCNLKAVVCDGTVYQTVDLNKRR